MNRALSPTVQHGKRTFDGHVVAYDLHTPPSLSAPAPLILLTHGFASDKSTLAGHAARLCAAGLVVLNINMSTLFRPTPEAAQVRNIAAVSAHVRWALTLSHPSGVQLVDPTRIQLAGHSAGGAVSLEAAMALRRTGIHVSRVCLLDAVPWPRTLREAGGLFATGAPGAPPPPAVLCLRSEPSAWNMRGNVLTFLATARAGRGVSAGASGGALTDALLVRSGHGDPISPPPKGCLVRALGLLGPPRCAELYAELLLAFARGEEAAALGALEGAELRVSRFF